MIGRETRTARKRAQLASRGCGDESLVPSERSNADMVTPRRQSCRGVVGRHGVLPAALRDELDSGRCGNSIANSRIRAISGEREKTEYSLLSGLICQHLRIARAGHRSR